MRHEKGVADERGVLDPVGDIRRRVAGRVHHLGLELANVEALAVGEKILCKLVECGEANVSALAEAVGLSQSALSQHLAKMRAEGLVAYRRESQTLWYRIADKRIERLFATLHQLYCATGKRR
ncbi:MAG TPA: metalloregulator ArsR/SmtB family transcription factor [Xanthobacteraceae bacterium]